ncbi:hypothetical protein [Streptomyces sp. NPDC014623]|uniref:SCO6745 family protein n=1 Tax=Streptomyces sp. NPDC014623 TaxID=3364875 RepID=UPI0036F9D617
MRQDELAALGLEREAMSYYAGRTAPLGAIGTGTGTATFRNSNHEHVKRYIPAAWTVTTPEAVLAALLRGVEGMLRRQSGQKVLASKEMAEAAGPALRAAERVTARRVRCAPRAGLPVSEQPHLALWYAATLLCEHRGNGHLASLAVAGLSGIEALVLHNATGTAPTSALATRTREWSAQQWETARGQLRERGLLNEAGDLMESGAPLRAETEVLTDRLDAAPHDHLGPAATARLIELVSGFSETLRAAGAFPAVHFGEG